MIELKITGMSCDHCVMAVTKALRSVPGVAHAEVSLANGAATVEGTPKLEDLVAAVEEEGYQAEEVRA